MRLLAHIRLIFSIVIGLLSISITSYSQPNPSISMQLISASMDSIVILLKFANNNVIWNCEGIQTAVAYDPDKLIPNFYGTTPIHDVRFAQFSWLNYSNPFMEADGTNPDLMLYAEGPNSGSVTIGANQQFNLCKMNWQIKPMVPPGSTSFYYFGNTGANGSTGYLWISDPDLRAFGSTSGLNGVYFPVELRSFTTRLEGNVILISWTTESETNNAGFDVERRYSTNGREYDRWSKIDFVAGRGTTNERTEYVTIDRSIHQSGFYQYRLKQYDIDGTISYSIVSTLEVPTSLDNFILDQNYPNPFGRGSSSGTTTSIRFGVPPAGAGASMPVQLKVYDMLGREVAALVDKKYSSGVYTVEFTAGELPGGVYVYQLSSGTQTKSRLMTIIR